MDMTDLIWAKCPACQQHTRKSAIRDGRCPGCLLRERDELRQLLRQSQQANNQLRERLAAYEQHGEASG